MLLRLSAVLPFYSRTNAREKFDLVIPRIRTIGFDGALEGVALDHVRFVCVCVLVVRSTWQLFIFAVNSPL